MKKRRRKWLRALLCALGAVVIAITAAALWQRENIRALINSKQYSGAEIERMLAEQDVNAGKILEKLPDISIRPLTEDEKEKVRSGELSENEALNMMLGSAGNSYPRPPPSGTVAGDGNVKTSAPPDPVPSPEDERQKRAAELVAKVYVLRESMTGQIDGLISAAKSDYGALPEEERTAAKKQELAARYLGEISAMEGSCDAQMKEIVGELEAILKEIGADASAAAEIMQAYKEEKNLKKSYFLSQYS
ncbi:MAG: hypothetical protein LBK23_09080 [Oscillospiraceae bacterium]|jgi:hypothetical protein|nr:hypothetical protein [Oscillospiraceae bacterium]